LRLALIGAVGACASPPPQESPLAIGYVWRQPTEPLANSTSSASPSEILIRWQPGTYTAEDIQSVADQQCASFRRTARAAAPPEPSPPQLLQRFVCSARP
jgi:hypothetical protein